MKDERWQRLAWLFSFQIRLKEEQKAINPKKKERERERERNWLSENHHQLAILGGPICSFLYI